MHINFTAKQCFIYSLVFLMSVTAGCAADSDKTLGGQKGAYENFSAPLSFAKEGFIELPDDVGGARKRGFDDFNCDGVPDKLQVANLKLVGQDWEASVFWGRWTQNDQGEDILSFDPKPATVKIELKKGLFATHPSSMQLISMATDAGTLSLQSSMTASVKIPSASSYSAISFENLRENWVSQRSQR